MTGKELEQRIKGLGMSQSSLARYWGIRQGTISDWILEKHKIQHPKILDDALKHLEAKKNENK